MKNTVLKRVGAFLAVLVVLLALAVVPAFADDAINTADDGSNSAFFSAWYNILQGRDSDAYYSMINNDLDSLIPFNYNYMLLGSLYEEYLTDPLFVNRVSADFMYIYNARFAISIDDVTIINEVDSTIRVIYSNDSGGSIIVRFMDDDLQPLFDINFISYEGREYSYIIDEINCYLEDYRGRIDSYNIDVAILTNDADNIGVLNSLMFTQQQGLLFPKSYRDGFELGAEVNYDSAYQLGKQDGFNEGYSKGKTDGMNTSDLYKAGYNDAVKQIKSGDFGRNFLGSILSAPFDALRSFTLVEWTTSLGATYTISLATLLSAAIGISIFIWFLKLFAGG